MISTIYKKIKKTVVVAPTFEEWSDEGVRVLKLIVQGFRGLVARSGIILVGEDNQVEETWLFLKEAWANLQTVIMLQRERHLPNQDPSLETVYFISTLSTSATEFLKIIRSHWGVENGLHWVLDVAFREDDSRLRKGYGDQNFAVLRQLALNLLRQDKSINLGVKGKRLKAGWDETYLRLILASAI